MSKRQNPFGDVPEIKEELPAPPDIYGSLRVAEKRQRNRDWERRHLGQKVVYRGVDPKLALRVREISEEINVRSGEVARFLLEYALSEYEAGHLILTPRPNPARMRMTLFPKETASRTMKASGSKKRTKKKEQPAWKVITTWRGFSPELKERISDLASYVELDVPVGELVSAFLRFSLDAHDQGYLKLEPVGEVRGNTLYEEGSL